MTLRELARHYSKWCSAADLADNAPAELRIMIADLARSTDRRLIIQSIKQLAGQGMPPEATLSVMLEFFAARVSARASLDDVLRSKKPPQSLEDLATRAYRDHYQLVMKQVRAWMMARLALPNP